MNIEDLTLKQIREIQSLNLNQPSVIADLQPYEIGKAYIIRTVTMIDIGIVKAVGDKEIVLSNASWIADTGRYSDALHNGAGVFNEVEPYKNDVIVGRGAVVDASEWDHDLPVTQK